MVIFVTTHSFVARWSAIQTLLERSLSDCLILLDCCAGAASATFPNGNSITETISASSWDAIAPDPGRYSFTNALIEVLQEWKHRTYSAAMLHAEVLARLKHPRPVLLNGKHFEARSTPVHFMMTSNHRAPSIEMVRTLPDGVCPPSPPQEPEEEEAPTPTGRSAGPPENVSQEPNEDVPHVMISLALEGDQQLDVNAWENWLAAFPAMAKYVKIQGVFKSHSTLVLLSLPVMVWDLLPENLACNFVAFIRSNNLAVPKHGEVPQEQHRASADLEDEVDVASIYSGTTVMTGAPRYSIAGVQRFPSQVTRDIYMEREDSRSPRGPHTALRYNIYGGPPEVQQGGQWGNPMLASPGLQRPARPAPLTRTDSQDDISMQPILNQSRGATTAVFALGDSLPSRPALAPHIQRRLEEYFQGDDKPTVAITEFLASNLGIETKDIDVRPCIPSL